MTRLYRLIDALCWHYEERFPRLANRIYDWLRTKGMDV